MDKIALLQKHLKASNNKEALALALTMQLKPTCQSIVQDALKSESTEEVRAAIRLLKMHYAPAKLKLKPERKYMIGALISLREKGVTLTPLNQSDEMGNPWLYHAVSDRGSECYIKRVERYFPNCQTTQHLPYIAAYPDLDNHQRGGRQVRCAGFYRFQEIDGEIYGIVELRP